MLNKKQKTELVGILHKARPQVDWFALGEAVRLAEQIRTLDGNSEESLIVSVSQHTMQFLAYRHIPNCQTLVTELQTALDSMEIPDHEQRNSF